MLEQSVIRKIQMAKFLYFLGKDCFKIAENAERIGAGIILLQDAVELFLIALCEQLKVTINDNVSFPGYFSIIKKEKGEDVPLSTKMLELNRQRVNLKHHGILPRIEDCRDFPVVVNNFFEESSARYLKINFNNITLIDLLKDSENKCLLKEAEDFLKSQNYKECQINCRKVIYLAFEKQYDIRDFEKGTANVLGSFASMAPSYATTKEYIEEHVKEPTDYIVLDYNGLDKDLLAIGISLIDYWNIRRITPEVYYYKEDKEWVIKDEFEDDIYNEENAEYSLRKTIEILLLKQENISQQRLAKGNIKTVKIKNTATKVYEKASIDSKIVNELDKDEEVYLGARIRGLKDKNFYCRIIRLTDKSQKNNFVYGFVCDEDIEER